MPVDVADAPRFTPADAERIAREAFGLDGSASPLPSERDQNFLIDGDRRAVLKLANAGEERALLEAQQAMLAHVAGRSSLTPRVLPRRDGLTLGGVDGVDGRRHLAWAVTFIDGTPLGETRRRSPALFRDLGRQVGALTNALDGFDHPAVHRDFVWDLLRGRATVDRLRPLLADAPVAAAIDRVVAEFDRRTAPLLDQLPRAVIHGDPNDHNVLVGGGADLETRDQSIVGIVDFGDALFSLRVGDLAVAVAYAMLDADDPLAVLAEMVRGYAEQRALATTELSALFGLAALRLCVSACVAADQRRRRPDNAYLGVSQPAIARLLPVLAATPWGLAEAVARDAAGLRAAERTDHVVRFLERLPAPAPVLGGVRMDRPLVLDLGVASPAIGGALDANAEPALTERVFAAMRAAGAEVAIGRYDEARLLYVAPAFAASNGAGEHRTIHIGLDLFAPAGTPVHAPLDGVIHACAYNGAPQDYGGVIILRHATDDGDEFFTLYGHLSRASLDEASRGRVVRAGERIAWLGAPEENGGWTPHLHLQMIVDLLELGTDFPGVARASQRSVWRALCPDPNLLVRVPADRFPPPPPSREHVLAARRAHLGPNLSLAYREPVRVVRGWMQYLYDDVGRRYLDAYNNVPHVGHGHPRVVDAAAAQMRVLNTNTRYLGDRVTEYAERLAALFPPGLDVCWFVSSASEANELALRLARAYTGRRDTIVLEAAYHGNTTTLIDVSPYKHAGPGGRGAPDWVHVAPLPDDYRGRFKRGDPEAGAKYAESVGALVRELDRRGRGVAAFLAETCPSVGGQIVLPKGYLANVYEYVRAAGGVCIADEVQTGLGRMGTSLWAFEDQGVVPDVVVLGKPLGNGHPLAAVVTTAEIARAFDDGMEYFSTFGGNTVSCAVGLAVLDVLRDEALQAHALRVGDHLLALLRPLAERHRLVGDVRGSGLFVGVELVRDRETLAPAAEAAAFVANRMRERGVLLGTDGPLHNVIKIRPPMPFTALDAEQLVAELDRALGEAEAAAFR